MSAVRKILTSMMLVGVLGACADLVVTDLQTTGTPTVNANNSAVVPVRVEVTNQGSADADIFKVSAQYTGAPFAPSTEFAVAFTVPGQSNIWYPFTNATLAAGDSQTFVGNLTFHPAVRGTTVTVTTTADSCSGDEFMPSHCRVRESSEGNNVSAAISVPLP